VLGMVRQWQTLFYDHHYSATVLDDGLDYVKVSEALGATARRVTTREEFEAAFQEALACRTPFVIDAIIDSDDKVWPMVAPGTSINKCIDGKDYENQNQ
jgi:acetolactate synthase-1/2/3 large subunit